MRNSRRALFAGAGWAILAAASPSFAEDEPSPAAAPLNFKIEVRCKLGDSPEQVFRLSDADGDFAAEHPSPPILFDAKLVRREDDAFVLRYSCAWRQDIKEAPRDPKDPKIPKGRGSFSEGSAKGKARVAVGRPVRVFDSKSAQVTITLLEIPAPSTAGK